MIQVPVLQAYQKSHCCSQPPRQKLTFPCIVRDKINQQTSRAKTGRMQTFAFLVRQHGKFINDLRIRIFSVKAMSKLQIKWQK